MSERGSFVTEYIYCRHCFEAVERVLLGDEKYLRSTKVFGQGHVLPIIAGKVGGLYQGEELDSFEQMYIPALTEVICHPVRIAVLAEHGQEFFTVTPARESSSVGLERAGIGTTIATPESKGL